MINVESAPSLWLYAIHSHNADLIHILEIKNVEKPYKDYLDIYIESIKCHHNEIAEYIENFYDLKDEAKKRVENISTMFKYHYYAFFPSKIESSDEFFYSFSRCLQTESKSPTFFDLKICLNSFYCTLMP